MHTTTHAHHTHTHTHTHTHIHSLLRSKPCRRIKLMVVGAANKGKTSLLMNLTKKGKMTRFKEVEVGYNNRPLATVGVDLGDWEYATNKKPKVTFMTWDFGGQVGLCLIPIPLYDTLCYT